MLWPVHARRLILLRYGAPLQCRVGLRAQVALAAAFGGLIAAGAGSIVRDWLEAGELYPWKAAGLFAAMMAIAAAVVREHPFPRLGSANHVTIVRAMLLALIAAAIGEPELPRVAGAAVATASVVAVLDGVDGWLARRSGMASPFGARFDMEIDALLVMVLSVLVWRHGKAGAWILAGGLMRYAFIAARWPLPWMGGALAPTLRGKTVAVAHVIGLNVALTPIIPLPFSALAAAATFAALTWSFAVDVGRLRRQRGT
jgi:phosphatidylglycerophosphate synthase